VEPSYWAHRPLWYPKAEPLPAPPPDAALWAAQLPELKALPRSKFPCPTCQQVMQPCGGKVNAPWMACKGTFKSPYLCKGKGCTVGYDDAIQR